MLDRWPCSMISHSKMRTRVKQNPPLTENSSPRSTVILSAAPSNRRHLSTRRRTAEFEASERSILSRLVRHICRSSTLAAVVNSAAKEMSASSVSKRDDRFLFDGNSFSVVVFFNYHFLSVNKSRLAKPWEASSDLQWIITSLIGWRRNRHRSSGRSIRISIIIISHAAIVVWTIHGWGEELCVCVCVGVKQRKNNARASTISVVAVRGTTCGRRRSVCSTKTFSFSFLYTLPFFSFSLSLSLRLFFLCMLLVWIKKIERDETSKLCKERENVLEENHLLYNKNTQPLHH